MHYASQKHERLFGNIVRNKGYPAATLAAIYLFTANQKLWRCWRKAVTNQGVDWTACGSLDPGWDAYFLKRAAISIARNSNVQVTLHDLTNRADYPKEAFLLVVTAVWIAWQDASVFMKILQNKGDNTC